MKQTSISKYLIEKSREYYIPSDLRLLIEVIARSCRTISYHIAQGDIAGNLGSVDSINIQGETQKTLDILANDILIEANEWGGHLAGLLSEEIETIQESPKHIPKGEFVLVFDPLDGSSNINVNLSIGTIFSVLPYKKNEPIENSFLQKGRNQVAAGYAIYGPQTMLVLTLGFGVTIFTLDKALGTWVLTDENLQIPKNTNEFSINMSNYYHWKDNIRLYVKEMLKGQEGIYKKYYNMRWNASFVAEIQRILIRGGIFMYPWDKRRPEKNGHLRLLYEANPMAMIIEQAYGKATNGDINILDIQPKQIHERVEVFCGSANEVDKIQNLPLNT